MALRPCRECGKEVSTEAEMCPNCGTKSPTKPPAKKATTKEILAGLTALAFIVFVISKCTSSDTELKKDPMAAAKAEAETSAKDAACKTDLQCWGDKNSVGASVYCATPVEKLAKYSAKWTDGTFELKFSRFRWLDKDKGTLTFIGDKIQFQNGFGAYQNHIAECDFDPNGNKVLDVRARPGRL